MASIEDLQREIVFIKETEDRDSREVLRYQFYDKARKYFDDRLKQEKGIITPEILREVDKIYDFDGLPGRVAEVLGLTPYQLRKDLGRQKSIDCKRQD